MEEHPSLRKRGAQAHGSGAGFEAAPRALGHVCRVLDDGTNRAWIVPTARLSGKAVPEREIQPKRSDVSPTECVLYFAKDSRIRLMSSHK